MVLSVPSVDVAGGYSPSILDAMRRTLDTSKTLTIQDPQHQTLTFEEVFRLATLGGSEGIRFQLLTKKLFNTCTGQYINLPGCFPPHSSLIGWTDWKLCGREGLWCPASECLCSWWTDRFVSWWRPQGLTDLLLIFSPSEILKKQQKLVSLQNL